MGLQALFHAVAAAERHQLLSRGGNGELVLSLLVLSRIISDWEFIKQQGHPWRCSRWERERDPEVVPSAVSDSEITRQHLPRASEFPRGRGDVIPLHLEELVGG